MRIIKTDGSIIDLNVDEYKSIYSSDDVKIVDNVKKHYQEVGKKIHENSVRMKTKTRKSMNRMIKGSKYHHRWTKKDDKIIMNNDTDTCMKLLPYRTKSGIWSRRCLIKTNRPRYGRCIRSDDKRVFMMKFVTSTRDKLMKTGRFRNTYDAQREAMNMYRSKYVKKQ